MVAWAQDPVTDSLVQQLNLAHSPTEKAEIYYQMGDYLAVQDTVKAVTYVEKGLLYVKGNLFYEGMGYFYLGRVYMKFSLTKAEDAFGNALSLFEQVNTPESYIYQSRTWANKAVMAQMQDDNRTYIKLFLEKAIPFAAKGGDSLRIADDYANISLPFMNYGEYEKALIYLGKSAALFKRLAPNDIRQVDIYCHMAKIDLLQNKTDEAGKHLRLASSLLEQDPASLYAPNFHTIESMYLIRVRLWNDALQAIERGLQVAGKLKSRNEIRQLLYQKAELFNAQGNWKAAKKVLVDMYNEGYIELVTDKRQVFGDLAKLESNLGNYKQAYDWMLKHDIISEEVYTQQTKAQITDLETRYNYVQKEKELLVAKAKTEKQKQLIWFTAIGSIIMLVFIYVWYRNRRIRAVQRLKQLQQIELGKALLEGQERERSRVARDLHDGLGGMLAGIKLNLSQMIEEKGDLRKEDLGQTVDRLGYSVSELRRISRNMMPESLLHLGLEAALKELCHEATLPKLKVIFNAFDLRISYSPQVQITIYRMVQELIYNAVKHSGASRILVQCSHAENTFFITVEDDGHGFSPRNVSDTCQGLKNISVRAGLLNGKMEIETSTEGTIVNIELYVEG